MDEAASIDIAPFFFEEDDSRSLQTTPKQMKFHKNTLTVAAALTLSSLVSATAFGATDDWDDWDDDWDDDSSYQTRRSRDSSRASSRDSRSSRDTSQNFSDKSRYGGWKLSIDAFYALSMDEYVDGIDDAEIDTFGITLNFNKEFYFGRSPIALDIGLLTIVGYGEGDIDALCIEVGQVDLMEVLTLGLKFNIADAVWLGFGGMVGADVRLGWGELDGDGEWKSDAMVGPVYGAYGTGVFGISDHFALNASVAYLCTNVEFTSDFDGAEDEISYVMFEIGVTWTW